MIDIELDAPLPLLPRSQDELGTLLVWREGMPEEEGFYLVELTREAAVWHFTIDTERLCDKRRHDVDYAYRDGESGLCRFSYWEPQEITRWAKLPEVED